MAAKEKSIIEAENQINISKGRGDFLISNNSEGLKLLHEAILKASK